MTASLLVVSDFDGTLAPIIPDPAAVKPNPLSLRALRSLADTPCTKVTILSGRGLSDLQRVCPLSAPVELVGSHGAESSLSSGPTQQQKMLIDAAETSLRLFLTPGVTIEKKPFHVVLHVARLAAVDPVRANEILDAAENLDCAETKVSRGKNVVEFSVASETKGTWLSTQLEHWDRVVFLGDDTTDEDGFRVLRSQDVGVKVGEGVSAATVRLRDTAEVATWLSDLALTRLG